MKDIVRVLACSLAVFLLCTSAMARLGETETESRERCGQIAARDAESAKVMEKIKALA